MIEAKYYVYEWYIKKTGEVFYVGKGSNNRVTSMKDRNEYFKNIRKKYECDYRIIKYFDNEEEAYNYELKRGLELKKQGQAKACYVLGNYKRYMSKEVLEKMKRTQFKKGKNFKPWNKGKKMNAEYKEKCRNRMLGTKQSEETRKKRSESLKNHNVNIETRQKIAKARMKSILVIDTTNKTETIYENISELAKELNICQSSLCRPLKSGKLYRNKYIIKYINTEVSN